MEKLKEHITEWIHTVKIKKRFEPKDWKWGKTMGVYVEWNGKDYAEYVKEKDFGKFNNHTEVFAKKKEYKGKPFIEWEVKWWEELNNDIEKQTGVVSFEKQKQVKELQWPQKELSIVTQSIFKTIYDPKLLKEEQIKEAISLASFLIEECKKTEVPF